MRCRSNFAVTLCVAAVAVAFAVPARADVTVVTETTTEIDLSGANMSDLGDPGDLGKPPELAVSYTKGKLSRCDTQDRIILRGLQEGTISILNPAARTYYITTEIDEYGRKNSDFPGTAGGNRRQNVKCEDDEHVDQGVKVNLGAYSTWHPFRL